MSSYKKLLQIADSINLPLNLRSLVKKPESVRVFDYSPVSHPLFLNVLFSSVEDTVVSLSFLNAARNEVKKSVALSLVNDSEAKLSELRRDYSTLFDCTVEGSVLVYGDTGAWLIYYDAERGEGMLVEHVKKLLPVLDDFVKPLRP